MHAQGKLPPLPSAKELARGDTQGYVTALYAGLDSNGANGAAEIARIKKTAENVRATAKANVGANNNQATKGAGVLGKLTGQQKGADVSKTNPKETKGGVLSKAGKLLGMDLSSLSKMAEDGDDKGVEAFAMQMAGAKSGMDIAALSKMSDKEAEAYALQMAGKRSGMDLSGLSSDNDEKENEAFAMQLASRKSGMDLSAVAKMNPDEIEKMANNPEQAKALTDSLAAGSQAQQAYGKEKEAFDRDATSARAKAADEMKRLFERKYSPLVQKAKEDMGRYSGDSARFNEAYMRWMGAKEDFRVECYGMWRDRIAAEQESFRKLSQTGRFEGMESQIAGDAMKIALDVLNLPELGIV
jgi:hypothetical protein